MNNDMINDTKKNKKTTRNENVTQKVG